MMVGLVKADQGEIVLGDTNITSEPIHKRALRGVGYLPQEASVFRELTVWENIYSVVECTEISKSEKNQRVEKLIEEFGLGHIIKSKGVSLSGGERRRVEIARALALNPKFILLDEPFAGVDPLAVNDIQDVIRGLKNKNIGVLITDHNVREILGIVDEVYIMNNGELLVNGTPEEILNSEKARKFYLGSQFRL
jgi:lipopolysaccharide export system ATP-binding protein